MDIIICGAGEVGRHAAEVLVARDNSITIIDTDRARLAQVGDTLDVRTLAGDCSQARVLLEAGAASADLVLATTSKDDVNLITASVAKGLGTRKAIARVHQSDYFEGRDFNYEKHFSIDRLICPEYSTAVAIGQTLRNPGALAIENFARGQIEMQQIPVSREADALGIPLAQLRLPKGTRLAAVVRKQGAFVPAADTVVEPGDSVVLVGDPAHFPVARRMFHDDKFGRRRVVIMGGPPMAVWLCRALKNRNISIRLFETNRQRAQELARELDWVTVLQADPTDRTVFEDERVGDADAFVALAHDEENILGCLLAKSAGVRQAVAVVEQSKYLHVLKRLGIDKPFSPRAVAVREIERAIDERPLTQLASLAEGEVDVYRVRIKAESDVVGLPLREVKLSPNWMLAAIQRNGAIHVPGAQDVIQVGDTLLVVGRHGKEEALRKVLDLR